MCLCRQLDEFFGADSNDPVLSAIESVRALWRASLQATDHSPDPMIAKSWKGYAITFDDLSRPGLRLFVTNKDAEKALRERLKSQIPLTVQAGVHFGPIPQPPKDTSRQPRKRLAQPLLSSGGPPDLTPGDALESKAFNTSLVGALVEEGTLGAFLKCSASPNGDVWILGANHVLALNGFRFQHLITTTERLPRTVASGNVDYIKLFDPPQGPGNLADVAVAKLEPGLGWTAWNTAFPTFALTKTTLDLPSIAANLMGSKIKSLRGTSGRLAGLMLQQETEAFQDMDISKAIVDCQWLVQDEIGHFAMDGDSGSVAIWESADGTMRFPLGIMIAVSKNDDGTQGEYTVVSPFDTALELLNGVLATRLGQQVDLQLQ